MPNQIIAERLKLIAEHIKVIEDRMFGISTSGDFLTKEGSVIYDSMLPRLQSVGENIKKIEVIQPGFTKAKLKIIEVDNIIRFRDLLSHHYELLDTEIVYNIIIRDIPPMKKAVNEYLKQQKKPKLKKGL